MPDQKGSCAQIDKAVTHGDGGVARGYFEALLMMPVHSGCHEPHETGCESSRHGQAQTGRLSLEHVL